MLNYSIDTHWKIAKISLGVRNTDVVTCMEEGIGNG